MNHDFGKSSPFSFFFFLFERTFYSRFALFPFYVFVSMFSILCAVCVYSNLVRWVLAFALNIIHTHHNQVEHIRNRFSLCVCECDIKAISHMLKRTCIRNRNSQEAYKRTSNMKMWCVQIRKLSSPVSVGANGFVLVKMCTSIISIKINWCLARSPYTHTH